MTMKLNSTINQRKTLIPDLDDDLFFHNKINYCRLMFFLQAKNNIRFNSILILGTLGMFFMAITLVSIVVFHQRRVIRFNKQIQKMEEERQQMLITRLNPIPGRRKTTYCCRSA